MSDSPNADRSRRLTDDEAHAVLARAAELDARLPSTVTLDELWSSAEAAGISRESFVRATGELHAGELHRTGSRVAVSAVLVRTGQVALALTLFYAAFRTPNYSGWWIAQSIGAAWAVYGAYKTVGAIAKWVGGIGGRWRSAHELPDSAPSDEASHSDTSMAVRILHLGHAPSGAA